MSRILKAYRTRFLQVLRLAGARRAEQGADWLVAKAGWISTEQRISLADALTRIYEELARRPRLRPARPSRPRTQADIRFFCDSGLGGLARWLRASGYEAWWEPQVPDERLLAGSLENQLTLLTTDSMLMERRVLRDKRIPSLWLPPTLSIAEQLARTFEEFDLSLGSPRCMTCGGELVRGDKEALRARIPPRTFRWLDEYFVCQQCGKLFWHGTHWSRITRSLKELAAARAYALTETK